MSEELCVFTGKPFNCLHCNGHKEEWLNRGSHIVHMGHSVSGPLSRNTKKDWSAMAKYMTRDNGAAMTGEEIQIEFMKYAAKGIETFPIGKCDRWCFVNGCQGHASEKQEAQ